MHGKFDSRHPLVGLSDELIRLNGRLKGMFAGARRSEGLGDSELTVLNAVVEADRAPTVPQIGRSLGQPRQIVQRAANSLIEAGLIEAETNPDHKRAVLLRATEQGVALKREIDARADAIAEEIAGSLDADLVRRAAGLLHDIRKELEARLRAGEKS
ncbi:MarR family winged helix-turn-helix transcriptional regulator [Novosphingobium sp. JCM 18896]|uniref:MarR family winged helix-turn-helix transcriptional regulator n=1 Tax=Novosphingobium sp. JCM 18896 TaxID=2989731 RepID=UPI002221D685|nr:MarR family transcriptional regulator [Novosphingobium sp. JCM 18896]MCW1428172.1 MarR family transcriptional regulator [Novosphingobium sp. JCM 18896]